MPGSLSRRFLLGPAPLLTAPAAPAPASAVFLPWLTIFLLNIAGRIWQHELDHLDGVLIIDRMRPIDRMAARRALKDLVARSTDG